MQFIDLKEQYKRIKIDVDNRINEVLEHGQYIMGPEVTVLEDKLAQFVGAKYCLSCSSGTDALLIALMAKGISPGDKIITTPFTYIATAEVIKLLGAEPVFVDIDPRTFNIDCNQINSLSDKQDIKGIIPVNLFGLSADYDSIYEISKKYKFFVLEDAAQSFGADYKNKKSGSLGDISATSFFPAKPLGCYGDGGAIFTDNQALYNIMESIRVHGKGENKYDCDRLGLNGRLDTIQAAILLSKLSIYEEEINLRQDVANLYSEKLKNYVEVPFIPESYLSVWAQYSILLKDEFVRENVIKNLKKENIPSVIYYQKPLHIQKTFNNLDYSWGDFPVSEDVSTRILSLPMHPYLSSVDIDRICKIFFKNYYLTYHLEKFYMILESRWLDSFRS